jgi:ABC-2 type transport system ATP-binding protein
MIHADSIDKRFSDVHAVRDLSLTAYPGEVFGLIGPNGAGKSTTIRMLVNIIEPDSGAITYDGIPFGEEVRVQIGYLPEERGLYQKSRVLETILHFARLRGVESVVAKERAAHWLKRFGLEGADRRKIEELSKGNQQKVQLIITLLHDPRYLILDEPASGLDPVNQEILGQVIDELRADGRVIIYSTHQMELAERLCNRIALIHKGEVVLSGSIDEVRQRHAANSVEIEFEGDGSFLEGLPMVVRSSVEQNFAELELMPSATVNDLLPFIADRLRVSRIARVRPSLKSIFIRTVTDAGQEVKL